MDCIFSDYVGLIIFIVNCNHRRYFAYTTTTDNKYGYGTARYVRIAITLSCTVYQIR